MSTGADYDTFLRERADETLRSEASNHSAVVCLAAPGVPVIFVSETFEDHTGYHPSEVVGRSLSLLQGPETEGEAVEKFRSLIKKGESGTVRISNYRKDGTVFLHECAFRPIIDSEGDVTHFVAIQKPVIE